MTWIDVSLIGFGLVSVGAGAFLGSLWGGACLLGGFFGAFLVDMLSSPAMSFLTHFPGSSTAIAVLLFLTGCVVVMIPGWFISKTVTILFFGLFDRAAGIVVGALAGLMAISIVLLGIVPLMPKIEKTSAWKKSSLVRPLQSTLEDIFSAKPFQAPSKLAPVTKEMGAELKEVATHFVDEVKKTK